MTFEHVKEQLTDTEAMILTVYGEARGDTIDGQIAVMNVIMNRAKKRKLSIKDVCFQPKQFSCWNSNDPNYPMLKELAEIAIMDRLPDYQQLRQIGYLTAGVIGLFLPDNTGGADHYMTTKLFNSAKKPSWAKEPKTKPRVIGAHTFLQV